MIIYFVDSCHVETVALLSKNWSQAEHYIDVKVDLAEMNITSAESKATYRQIKDWVKENYGIKTRNEYIARVKEKYGIIEHENSRPSQNPDYVRRDCPENQWKPIEEALKYYRMI